MNILVLGGGGREHAICWAVRKSRKCRSLFCIPGNAGISEIAVCKNLDLDKKNSNSNVSSIEVGTTDIDFTAYIKAENMKIVPGEYDVALSKAKIAHFINKKVPVQYWIALEADSIF